MLSIHSLKPGAGKLRCEAYQSPRRQCLKRALWVVKRDGHEQAQLLCDLHAAAARELEDAKGRDAR